MAWTSALAVYLLFWVLCAFFVLPFHGRRTEQAKHDVAGADIGAPATIRVGAIMRQTTIVATVFFAVYYVVYTQGWVDGRAVSEAISGR
jgi:predicted secreted protein